MRFSIEKSILEAMLNFLASRPYNEVAQIIATVQQDIEPINEQTEEVKG